MVSPFFTDIVVNSKKIKSNSCQNTSIFGATNHMHKTAKENRQEPKYIVQSEKYNKAIQNIC